MGENRPVQRPHYLAFGLAGYLASLLSMVYFGGFLANLAGAEERRQRRRGPAPAGRALAVDLALLLAFAVVHSLLARRAVKERLAGDLPARARAQPLFARRRAADGPDLLGLATAAVAGLGVRGRAGRRSACCSGRSRAPAGGSSSSALATIGSTHLFGLQQAWSAARGAPYVAPPFEIRGIYRLVRHPVYTGSLIALWSTPTMSQGRLLLVGVLTLYLFVGLAFEERDLEREFGDAYREHKRRVPSLFPRLLK